MWPNSGVDGFFVIALMKSYDAKSMPPSISAVKHIETHAPCPPKSFHPCNTHFVHAHLFEGRLQDFEVLNVLVLQIGAEFDSLHRHRTGEQHVHVLAVGGTCVC